MENKKAIIIGAGPAGLTAALELLEKTDVKPVIYEMSGVPGGISGTYNYRGNRMDMGGHRFFSKSDEVMAFWQKILPMEMEAQNPLSHEKAPDPSRTDRVMLVRNRLSRIFYQRNFFDYPVCLNGTTVKNLGLYRMVKIGLSYLHAMVFKIKEEKSLEDFMVNRFGRELYNTFFRDYTYKLWGVPPSRIPPDWGAQRIKGLSIIKVLAHAVRQIFVKGGDISQKDVATSLIDKFLYPKFGPGQLWEAVAAQIVEKGGEIYYHHRVGKVYNARGTVTAVDITDDKGNTQTVYGDYFLSSMPVKELVSGMQEVPTKVQNVATGLMYRDFITVGLLLKKMNFKDGNPLHSVQKQVPDNWIYIQERDVSLGRLQIFNNWSPYMVKDPENTVWIGLEYFCNEGDTLWQLSEEEFKAFAIEELVRLDLIERQDVLDSCMVRVPKAYPAYFGTYNQFPLVKDYLNGFENLFLIGRNGMHRYNNMDHSMLTAMEAVTDIATGNTDKQHIWQVNSEEDYHEIKKAG